MESEFLEFGNSEKVIWICNNLLNVIEGKIVHHEFRILNTKNQSGSFSYSDFDFEE